MVKFNTAQQKALAAIKNKGKTVIPNSKKKPVETKKKFPGPTGTYTFRLTPKVTEKGHIVLSLICTDSDYEGASGSIYYDFEEKKNKAGEVWRTKEEAFDQFFGACQLLGIDTPTMEWDDIIATLFEMADSKPLVSVYFKEKDGYDNFYLNGLAEDAPADTSDDSDDESEDDEEEEVEESDDDSEDEEESEDDDEEEVDLQVGHSVMFTPRDKEKPVKGTVAKINEKANTCSIKYKDGTKTITQPNVSLDEVILVQ